MTPRELDLKLIQTHSRSHANAYFQITPKPFEAHDVEVQIQACGVCGSDVHTITGGWGAKSFPLCCGHEIIGKAVRVGPEVTLIKTGQRVGIGAQIYACLECKHCKNDNETYCVQQIDTYGATWFKTGIVTQGGFSSHIRAHEVYFSRLWLDFQAILTDSSQHWVFPIPDALETANAAPMLCAGLTAFSPLVRNSAGPGKKVGIVGMGGIGHFGIIFAKALGAETWAISRSHAKEGDANELGADGFIATQDKDWNLPHRMTFDLIINTANSSEGFDLGKYLSLLDVHGRWISVGLPEGAGQEVKANMLMSNGCLIGATHLGSRKEMIRMLQLAAENGLKSWVEEIPISEEGLADASKLLMSRLSNTKY